MAEPKKDDAPKGDIVTPRSSDDLKDLKDSVNLLTSSDDEIRLKLEEVLKRLAVIENIPLLQAHIRSASHNIAAGA